MSEYQERLGSVLKRLVVYKKLSPEKGWNPVNPAFFIEYRKYSELKKDLVFKTIKTYYPHKIILPSYFHHHYQIMEYLALALGVEMKILGGNKNLKMYEVFGLPGDIQIFKRLFEQYYYTYEYMAQRYHERYKSIRRSKEPNRLGAKRFKHFHKKLRLHYVDYYAYISKRILEVRKNKPVSDLLAISNIILAEKKSFFLNTNGRKSYSIIHCYGNKYLNIKRKPKLTQYHERPKTFFLRITTKAYKDSIGAKLFARKVRKNSISSNAIKAREYLDKIKKGY